MQVLPCTLYADVLLVSILIDVMQDDGIPAVGMFADELLQTETPHVHHNVTLRFDDVVCPADNFVGVMGTHIVAGIDKMCPSRTEERDSFFQPADDAGVVAHPGHHFFGPLEMDDVIGLVRLPEFLCGTSHVNTCHSDSITQYRYEQIARISVFSKDDERCYRRTACIFTVIHVFLF